MKAKLLVSAALILCVLGLLTQFAPMVSTPATATYTTQIPYTVVSTLTSESTFASTQTEQTIYHGADIEYVSFQGVGDSLNITMKLSKGGFEFGSPYGGHYYYWIFLSPSENETAAYVITLDGHGGVSKEVCHLWHDMFDLGTVQKLDCLVSGNTWTVTVPKSVFPYQSGFYARAWIPCWPQQEVEPAWMVYFFASVPPPPCCRPGDYLIDVVPGDYASPLKWSYINLNAGSTQTTYSHSTVTSVLTSTSSYSSTYSVMVPLVMSLPWIPVMLLLVATCLFASAIYVSRRSPRK